MCEVIQFVRNSKRIPLMQNQLGANMGEVIRFVPRSERERVRLIREAHAIYDSIFPPADAVDAHHETPPASRPFNGSNAHRRDGGLLP
jgi:hypothetical protein